MYKREFGIDTYIMMTQVMFNKKESNSLFALSKSIQTSCTAVKKHKIMIMCGEGKKEIRSSEDSQGPQM